MTNDQKRLLLNVAKASIEHGLVHQTPLKYPHHSLSAELLDPQACFVTLHINHQLRGCIGTLQPAEALIDSVCNNAYKAAFEDYRFKPLTEEEAIHLEIDISIIGKSEAMNTHSEEDLLRQLKPNIDGLTLHERHYCSTFLPAVWQQLTDPKEFLSHLKQKAGLAEDYWSDTIRFERYSVECFSESESRT